jgi:stage V sporulation protein B
MRKLLESSLILTFSNLAVRISGYLYRIIMGWMLTRYEFGVLNLALPLQYLVVILASTGIAPSIAKFVAERKENKRALGLTISSSIFYYSAIGIICGLVFYLLAQPIGLNFFRERDVVLPLKISAVALPFGFLVAVCTGIFQGFMKMSYMAFTLLFQQFARIGLAIFFTLISATAVSAILGSTLGFAAAVPIAYILFRRLDQRLGDRDFGIFREIFGFSIPVSITAISAFALAYVDILLLGYFLTPVEVGIYSAASPTSRLILAFCVALYATLVPSISELKAKRDLAGIREHVRYSYKLSTAILVPATLFSAMFSEQIIGLLFPPEYIDAAEPFKILVIGTAFLGIFTINSGIFQGLGKPNIPMRILSVTAILDVLLNILLIPKFEIVGAALASTLSFVFAGLTSIFLLRFVLK